ncbi:MAG: TonB-dependent receptor, partial [Emcibacteraceae bacterium]|nr:TonB-dependent receptor [Emcibacteraceae bacterium]
GQENTSLEKSEKIFRTSLTRNITTKQNLEVGAEAAINTFNKAFVDNRRDLAGDPLALRSSDNVEIKENRYEIFANHTYNIASNLVLQSSLTTEFSKIIADSITTNTRRDTSFKYVKPRMNLRYDFTSSDQLRITAEKRVSQLDFNNFVTSFDQRTDQLVFGNTAIRPEQLWELSAAFEHRFPNDGGSVEVEVFYRDYTDHITKVDFTEYENLSGNPIGADEFFALPTASLDILRDNIAFTSKSGNIDGATAKGVKLKGNVRLGFLGLPQAVISAGYIYEKRRETDQFTLEQINFNRVPDHTFTYSYRHDVTSWDFSYGIEGTVKSEIDNRERNYVWPWKFGSGYKLFAEKTIAGNYKFIAELWQADMGTGHSTLTYYNDHRRFNDVSERTEKDHKSPKYLRFMLQGTF